MNEALRFERITIVPVGNKYDSFFIQPPLVPYMESTFYIFYFLHTPTKKTKKTERFGLTDPPLVYR